MNLARKIRTACLNSLFIVSTATLAAPVHVETIIFAHSDVPSKNPEWFEKPTESILVEDINFTDELISDLAPETEETPIPVQSKELTEIAKILEDHPDYTLLNYLSWVQEPVRKPHTIAVSLDIEHPEYSVIPQLLLSGEISVYEVQQILQMEINVIYSPELTVEQDAVNLPQPVSLHSKGVEYQLNDRRQVRIGELHYLDHPKIGVIFYMVRPEKPETPTQ